MTRLIAWPLAAISTAVLAQGDSIVQNLGWEGFVVNLGALGGLLWALFYLLKFHLPRKDELHREEIRLQREQFTKSLDVMAERHDRSEQRQLADSALLRDTLKQTTDDLRSGMESLKSNCMETWKHRERN